eukprot:NODE_12901_length_373_cov_1.916667_g11749_i0.p5 GENE.NODE_12901_length_373_cov_1.916667_g11749_i0~~NODE_12901_length_373_cov_1.916667_g11749_i0.p5  ORF type:complete len:64 (+),score=0.20 NODE_12901_length_373_cov_1.916667_g11749_i0:175-366(+)
MAAGVLCSYCLWNGCRRGKADKVLPLLCGVEEGKSRRDVSESPDPESCGGHRTKDYRQRAKES